MVNISFPVKYLIVSTASMLTTLLCFLLMIALISVELSKQPDLRTFNISVPVISPIRPKEKPVVREKAQKSLPFEPPPLPEGEFNQTDTRILTESSLPNRVSLADIIGEEAIQFKLTPPLSDLIPLSVVQPVYPFVAAVKEIEGYVLVQFSVLENGSVRNALIVRSEPRQIFDEAALNAVRKFKFRPRMVGGDPVPVDNIQLRFIFSMQSSYAQFFN